MPHRRLVTPLDGKWIRPTLTPSNRVTTWLLGPHESARQTASRSVQPFSQAGRGVLQTPTLQTPTDDIQQTPATVTSLAPYTVCRRASRADL